MAEVYSAAPTQATPVDRQALRDAWIALLGFLRSTCNFSLSGAMSSKVNLLGQHIAILLTL
jgi:hypothetical protein